MADFINALVGAQVLTPGAELERYLRQLAGLPDMPEKIETRSGGAGEKGV